MLTVVRECTHALNSTSSTKIRRCYSRGQQCCLRVVGARNSRYQVHQNAVHSSFYSRGYTANTPRSHNNRAAIGIMGIRFVETPAKNLNNVLPWL